VAEVVREAVKEFLGKKQLTLEESLNETRVL